MKTTKCPYCGASLELSRAVNGLVTCEYCDSEISVKTTPDPGQTPPVRGPVITGTAPVDPALAAARKKWNKTMWIWAAVQCGCMAFSMSFIQWERTFTVLVFLAGIVLTFVLPFALGAKYPAEPGRSSGKVLAGLGVWGTQLLGFWAGVFIAAAFQI